MPGWEKRPRVFWSIQFINLTFGSLVILFEIDGLPTIANFVVGLLFFFHIVQNNLRLQKWKYEKSNEEYRLQQQEDKRRFPSMDQEIDDASRQ